LITGLFFFAGKAYCQYPASCASVGSRANSNGQANNCPNVSGTAYAANFAGTSYATVPVPAKTGNFQLSYAGANASLKPFAITRVWQTNPSTVLLSVLFGPASVPTISGGNTLVDYCFYGANLPAAGKLTFEFTNPETGIVWGICSYDATCNSNCATVANPAALLPVIFSDFKVFAINNMARLDWTTAQESNNKGFTIEKSSNGLDFTSIGFVASHHPGGNSNITTRYSFSDNETLSGNSWYRLRQEDLDGKFYFSAAEQARPYKGLQEITIRNAGDKISIHNLDPATGYTVMLYDIQGRLAYQKNIKMLKELDIPGLQNKRQYFVTITPGNGEAKIVKSILLY